MSCFATYGADPFCEATGGFFDRTVVSVAVVVPIAVAVVIPSAAAGTFLEERISVGAFCHGGVAV